MPFVFTRKELEVLKTVLTFYLRVFDPREETFDFICGLLAKINGALK